MDDSAIDLDPGGCRLSKGSSPSASPASLSPHINESYPLRWYQPNKAQPEPVSKPPARMSPSSSQGKSAAAEEAATQAAPIHHAHPDRAPCPHVCCKCGGPRDDPKELTGQELKGLESRIDSTYKQPSMLWSLMMSQERLEFPDTYANANLVTSRRRRALHERFVKYVKARSSSEDADIRDLFDGHLVGDYQWDEIKRRAIAMLEAEQVRIDESVETVKRLQEKIHEAVERERHSVISRQITAALGGESAKAEASMITGEGNSLTVLQYELQDCELLMGMINAARQKVEVQIELWNELPLERMGVNTAPKGGREMIRKAGMDWDKTVQMIAAKVAHLK